jgi:polygalacturonase
VERVTISTSDDAVTIKSGDAPPGLFPPIQNITIRDSALSSAEACVGIGSEVTGGCW